MTSITYAIVFSGDLVEGFQTISVKAHLAKMLKADADKMAVLFSGKAVVLKRTQDKQEAVKYGSALKKVGADVKIKAIKSDKPVSAGPRPDPLASTSTGTTVDAGAPTAPDTSTLTLAPMEGNIVEPAPEPEAPALDLSGIDLADDDGSFLVEPVEDERLELDLTEYVVAENDGSPIVEPAPEVPKLDAPDFGLDEPGAVLETLVEEKELLSPDTTGISIAAAGSDIIDPEERDEGPPPVSPDTSKINLVANFDP